MTRQDDKVIGTIKLKRAGFVLISSLILTAGLFAQEIRVISPNGGEEFNCGQRISIKWTSNRVGNIVKIAWTRGTTVTTPHITDHAPNPGVFNYTIPSNITPGNNYKIAMSNAQE